MQMMCRRLLCISSLAPRKIIFTILASPTNTKSLLRAHTLTHTHTLHLVLNYSRSHAASERGICIREICFDAKSSKTRRMNANELLELLVNVNYFSAIFGKKKFFIL